MRTKKIGYWIGVIALLLSQACGEAKIEETTIQFEEPQPAREKSEKIFRRKFTGEYSSPTDTGTVLLIRGNNVIRKMTGIGFISKAEADTTEGLIIREGKIFDTSDDKNPGYPFQLRRDTFFVTITSMDTIFSVYEKHVLKYYKGFYFLNRKSDWVWAVERMGFDKEDKLRIDHLEEDEDLTKLQQVTPVKVNTDTIKSVNPEESLETQIGIDTTYLAKPRRKEFRKFLHEGGFVNGETWVKVKTNH